MRLLFERARLHLKAVQAASAVGNDSVAFDMLGVRWGSAEGAGPASPVHADSAFNSRLNRFQLSGSLD